MLGFCKHLNISLVLLVSAGRSSGELGTLNKKFQRHKLGITTFNICDHTFVQERQT